MIEAICTALFVRVMARFSTGTITRLAHRKSLGSWKSFGIKRILRSYYRCERLLGQSSCLMSSVTIHLMLLRHGIPSKVAFGGTFAPNKEFAAHAWVEVEGSNLIDHSVAPQFVKFSNG